MKTKPLYPVLLAMATFRAVVFGAADSPSQPLFADNLLDRMALSVSLDAHRREIVPDNGSPVTLQSRHWLGRISFDARPWLTLRTGLGFSEVDERRGSYGDAGTLWLAGATAKLWQLSERREYATDILWSVVAALDYLEYGADVYGHSFDWSEWRAAATLEAEVVMPGPRAPVWWIPRSATFIAGPVYSNIDGRGIPPRTHPAHPLERGAFSQDREFGLLLGVDVLITPVFSVGWQGRIFERGTHSLALTLHL